VTTIRHHATGRWLSVFALAGGMLLGTAGRADEPSGTPQPEPELSADSADAPLGLFESLTGSNINKSSFLERNGIRLDGWLDFGIGGNPRGSRDGFNGPVTFADKTNDVTLNQLYGYVERTVDDQGNSWDFGYRADIFYGTDARFALTKNLDDNLINGSTDYKLAVPQTYLSVFAPVGNGLTITAGHFYTIIGYEVVTAPDNFFFSHAYTMQYAEPFTQTGILMSYPINDNFSVTGGVVSGWDAFFQDPPNFLGGVNFTSDDEKTSVATSLITGDATEDNKSNRTMYSIVVTREVTDDLQYVFQHDFGIEKNAATFGQTAHWYGINQYLTYSVMDALSAALRFEWFRDEEGVRVGFGSNSYFGITGGLNWSPTSFLTLRPELRYDWSTNNDAYDGATKDDQFMISVDAIIQF
jgi:Putative beta-barrel porin-2, OmpL-like. bbp2